MYRGTIPAVATPFTSAESTAPPVDMDSFSDLLEWLTSFPLGGVVICGSTGEAATLTNDERVRLWKRSREIVRDRMPIIAGTGTNSTQESIAVTKAAREAGADGALIVAPYYNKPTQEGLFQHFRMVAEEGGLPVTVYNIPGRSVVEILPETMRRIAALPGVVAVKHAVDSATRLLEIAAVCTECRIDLLAGDDPITYAAMSVGGTGVISASATVMPGEMLAITDAMERNDFAAGLAAQQRALPMIQSLFLETNPIPAKAALKLMKRIRSEAVRLPLVTASAQTVEHLRRYFHAA